MSHTTYSEQETHALAHTFLKQLTGGEVIELVGDLGSGKTAFVRGLAEALGAKARVKSPTFTVMNEYPVEGHPSIERIVHIDLYRFKDPSQISALEFNDYKNDETIICIEWPNIFNESVIDSTHVIKFKFIDENTREIVIES